ncbi:putative teichuronic acid biosynthesis glycosyltransferase TuaH [Rubripirellula amarantea]|uniref:Putative teichuronic acid biosynthesis glycosyltransferase TuaH n=1 Tax=Rubripirellula amarantea TaxID=2527999 RepID=A0A5C5WSD6_9BACT|nr:glycosyltransferase family 4 protein [Rubripirellula amarantea]TWT52692.1 putative teichuronic acid biosynthesis glycosyltransferase TuaH [Rubripirellula amarantea]
MKIAYISGSYLPSRQANSIHVMRMSEAMASLGHDVTLYARRGEIDGQSMNVAQLHEFYDVPGTAGLAILPKSRFAQGREFWYALSLRRRISQQKPDLIYGRHTLGLFACRHIARTVYEIHSVRSGLTELIERRLIRSRGFAGVVSITQKLSEDFQHQHSYEAPIHVEPDAVNPVDYDTITPISLPGVDRLKVGYCGHLYPGRGGEFLVELARMLPQMDFHLVGGEPSDIERCQKLSDGLSNLIFHDFVRPQSIPQFLKAFDILVAPYQDRVQAFGKENIAKWISPMKLFEYMDAGKPIVVSDLPVLREVVTHGKTAWMVSTGDLQQWKAALLQLQDVTQRQSLGMAAQKLVRSDFTWNARAQRIFKRLSTTAEMSDS